MLELIKKTVEIAKSYAKPTAGAVGAIGAGYVGVIDPETATGICVAVYTAWITMK